MPQGRHSAQLRGRASLDPLGPDSVELATGELDALGNCPGWGVGWAKSGAMPSRRYSTVLGGHRACADYLRTAVRGAVAAVGSGAAAGGHGSGGWMQVGHTSWAVRAPPRVTALPGETPPRSARTCICACCRPVWARVAGRARPPIRPAQALERKMRKL